MKKKDKQHLRDIEEGELLKLLKREETAVFQLKIVRETGKKKDLHAYAKKRKDIARILTEIRHRELAQRMKVSGRTPGESSAFSRERTPPKQKNARSIPPLSKKPGHRRRIGKGQTVKE